VQLKNKTAVVTGAGSGIGRAIAVSLGRRGVHLALADTNQTGLDETTRLLSSYSVRVSQHVLDVSDPTAVAACPAEVLREHPGVHILVNNAGVALHGRFEESSAEDFEWLFSINFWGVVRMTRAFLPLLRQADEAQLVNLSSVFGLIAPAGQTAYAASKFAVRGFSLALRHELMGNSNIGVTVVHPGGVATRIVANARVASTITSEEREQQQQQFQKRLRMPPARAGEIIVKGIERRKARVLVGSDAKAIALIERLLPVAYGKLLARRGL
jgi:short-subunit dehydrogenase